MSTTHKLYPHITGLCGDEGENAATLAVVAVLDPSPHYPDGARIIVGSTRDSDAEVGGFSGGPAAIRQLARTLDQAAADVEAATGVEVGLAWIECLLAIAAAARRYLTAPPASFDEDGQYDPRFDAYEALCAAMKAYDGTEPRSDAPTASAPRPAAAAAEQPSPKPIPATWTDEDGTGPDTVVLTIEGFPPPEVAAAFARPELHRAVHLSIGHEPGETYVSNAGLMIGGALALRPAAAAELHRQLGAWLEVHRG